MRLRFAVALFLACGPAVAVDITVDVLGDPVPDGCTPGSCSLREAVSLSNSLAGTDRILLPATPGTPLQLALPGLEAQNAGGDLDIHDDVEILGAGVDATTLVQTVADRIFEVHLLAPHAVTLRGLSMQGGNADAGGAVRTNAVLVVSDAEFAGNSATQSGGAIWFYANFLPEPPPGPRLVLRRVSFSGNGAGSSAGALYAGAGSDIPNTLGRFVLIEDSLFEDNRAMTSGGAIELNGGANGAGGGVHVLRTSFSGNTSLHGGGALYVTQFAAFDLVVTDSIFDRNGTGPSAVALGGAIAAGRMRIEGSIFTRNSAREGGAAFSRSQFSADASQFCDNAALLSGGAVVAANDAAVTNTTFCNNTVTTADPAEKGGGALAFQGLGQLLVERSTFDGNDALRGGAISLGNGHAYLRNNTLATTRAEVDGRQGTLLHLRTPTGPATFDLRNTILRGTCRFGDAAMEPAFAGHTFESPGDTCRLSRATAAVGNQVDVDERALGLAALGDNGGPTLTRMLFSNSAAIDNARPSDCSALDQRGYPRAATACDAGSVERSATLPTIEVFSNSFE
jgi:predicted outer membrane repeat protein